MFHQAVLSYLPDNSQALGLDMFESDRTVVLEQYSFEAAYKLIVAEALNKQALVQLEMTARHKLAAQHLNHNVKTVYGSVFVCASAQERKQARSSDHFRNHKHCHNVIVHLP